MGKYLALRDLRLSGGVPARSNLSIINTGANTTLVTIFHQIKAAAVHAGGRVNAMFVLCHGFAGFDQNAKVCMDAGGMGLLLGRENVVHSNVAMWKKLAARLTASSSTLVQQLTRSQTMLVPRPTESTS